MILVLSLYFGGLFILSMLAAYLGALSGIRNAYKKDPRR